MLADMTKRTALKGVKELAKVWQCSSADSVAETCQRSVVLLQSF